MTNMLRWCSLTPFSTSVRMRWSTFLRIATAAAAHAPRTRRGAVVGWTRVRARWAQRYGVVHYTRRARDGRNAAARASHTSWKKPPVPERRLSTSGSALMGFAPFSFAKSSGVLPVSLRAAVEAPASSSSVQYSGRP